MPAPLGSVLPALPVSAGELALLLGVVLGAVEGIVVAVVVGIVDAVVVGAVDFVVPVDSSAVLRQPASRVAPRTRTKARIVIFFIFISPFF